jgi:hypothetical protein
MKINNFSVVKILSALFLTFAFAGIQDVNAQFWKKKQKEDDKEAVKKNSIKKE